MDLAHAKHILSRLTNAQLPLDNYDHAQLIDAHKIIVEVLLEHDQALRVELSESKKLAEELRERIEELLDKEDS